MNLRTQFAGLHWHHAVVPAAIVGLVTATIIAIAGLEVVLEQMRATLLLLGIVLALTLPIAMPALAQSRWSGWVTLGTVAGLFALTLWSLSLPQISIFSELDWNWQGKTLDLVWCLVLIAMLNPQVRREIGWTWTTRPGTLLVAFINILILVAVGFFALGTSAIGGVVRELTLEQILFDTSYPNLVEEIVFRGFMLALLDRAFGMRWTFAGARIGWGIILTAWLFGLGHGIAFAPDGAIIFEPAYLIMTFVAGLLFGWIRALTGSLWPAYLAHSAPEVGILMALVLR